MEDESTTQLAIDDTVYVGYKRQPTTAPNII